MTRAVVKVTTQSISPASWDAFDSIIAVVKQTMAPTSQRVYDQTFGKWADYCKAQGIAPLDLHPKNVVAFLAQDDTTYTTRCRQFSARGNNVSRRRAAL